MTPTSRTITTRDDQTLVGRDREWRIVMETLDAALNGRGSLMLIGGEAGIGKTALAEAGCRAAGDAIVLVGRCYELSETPPYGPWVELFSRYQPGDDRPGLPAAFAQPGTVGEVASQTTLFRQVQEFFAALATPGSGGAQPVVILLEDLHWADPASLDLLRFLVRDLTSVPILLLATYRSDELTPEHPLAQLLPALVRESRAERVELQRLELADIRALVTWQYEMLDDDRERLVDHLYGRAGGNPFFTVEILRNLEEARVLRPGNSNWQVGDLSRVRVPPLVRQVIEDRLARLDRDRRRQLAIAAVIGQRTTLSLWASVTGDEIDALQLTIERAVSSNLMEETLDGTAMRFVHALIRETLYERTPLPMRQEWHRKVAETLLMSTNPDPDGVAGHLQRAGDARAAEWLTRAGDRAQRAFAWVTAVERYQAALDLLERDRADPGQRTWLLCLLGLLQRYSDPQRGVTFLERAARLARQTADPVLEATTQFYQGHLRTLSGDWIRGIDQYGAGIAALDALVPKDRRRFQAMIADGRMAREHNPWATYSVGLVQVGRYAEAEQVITRLIEEQRDSSERERIHHANAYRALAEAHAAFGRPGQARQAAARARSFYQALDHQAMLGRTATIELRSVVLPYETERIAERQQLADVAEHAWALAGGSMSEPDFSPRSERFSLLVLEGDWDEASRLGSTMLQMVFFADAFSGEIARLARWRGDPDLARRIVDEVMTDGPQTPPGKVRFQNGLDLQQVAAALAIDSTDLDTATAWLDAHDRWLAWNGALLGEAEGHLGWATWHRAAGDPERAVESATAAFSSACDPRQPLALIAAQRLLGELETDLGQFDAAESNLQASLSLAETCGALYERACSLYSLGRLSHGRGESDAAARHVDEASAICGRLDAQLLLTHITALQAQLGEGSTSTLPAGITTREIEVLRLAAQGLDNAGIAEELFISAHTVHRHMANIFTKLDVPSRTAAVAWALRQGLL